MKSMNAAASNPSERSGTAAIKNLLSLTSESLMKSVSVIGVAIPKYQVDNRNVSSIIF